jgi:hypothetical protein
MKSQRGGDSKNEHAMATYASDDRHTETFNAQHPSGKEWPPRRRLHAGTADWRGCVRRGATTLPIEDEMRNSSRVFPRKAYPFAYYGAICSGFSAKEASKVATSKQCSSQVDSPIPRIPGYPAYSRLWRSFLPRGTTCNVAGGASFLGEAGGAGEGPQPFLRKRLGCTKRQAQRRFLPNEAIFEIAQLPAAA